MYAREVSKSDGVMILTLDIGESAQVLNSFMQPNSYDFPVLLNAASAAVDYGVSGIPMTFFISRAGTIEHIKLGAFSGLTDFQSALNKIS
jgi:hypothetical protein